MPGNKKKTNKRKSGKTKAMKRKEKGLPSLSAPTALCFPPARPKGCAEPMYVHSKPLGGYLIYGCHCPLTSTTCCCDKIPPNSKSPLTPSAGYTTIAGRCPHNVTENSKFYRRTLGLELRAKVGVCGFADTNGRDVHIVYGYRILEGKPWRDGSESFHTWLEDSNGLIYDHVCSHAIELGDICGADTSRVTENQRFLGVSQGEMLSRFGLWYESHPTGNTFRDSLNAEIEMGFTEPWPRGTTY